MCCPKSGNVTSTQSIWISSLMLSPIRKLWSCHHCSGQTSQEFLLRTWIVNWDLRYSAWHLLDETLQCFIKKSIKKIIMANVLPARCWCSQRNRSDPKNSRSSRRCKFLSCIKYLNPTWKLQCIRGAFLQKHRHRRNVTSCHSFSLLSLFKDDYFLLSLDNFSR